MNEICVIDVVKKFNLKTIINEKYLSNKIFSKELNIASLELAGYSVTEIEKKSLMQRAVILGNKELEFIKTLKKEEKIKNYKKLFDTYKMPAVFYVDNFKDKDLESVIKDYNIPLIKVSEINKYEFISLYVEYLSIYLSRNVIFHGSFVNVYGYGTLIIGNSGLGKSEAVLDLVKKKHLFVGDDSIVLTRRNNKIIGRSNDVVKNFLEVRGIGIINLVKLYGAQTILNESNLDLVIELVSSNKNDNIDRLGKSYLKINIHNIEVPKLKIPVRPGRSVSDIIETAVAKYKSDVIIGSSFDEFDNQQKKYLEKK